MIDLLSDWETYRLHAMIRLSKICAVVLVRLGQIDLLPRIFGEVCGFDE
jgi:hypothetical protein